MKDSGIYKWTNIETGHVYIGKAKCLSTRKQNFLNWNHSYSGENIDNMRCIFPSEEYWKYDILEKCEVDKLKEREDFYINEYKNKNVKLLNTQLPSTNRQYKKEKNSTIAIDKHVMNMLDSYCEKMNINKKQFISLSLNFFITNKISPIDNYMAQLNYIKDSIEKLQNKLISLQDKLIISQDNIISLKNELNNNLSNKIEKINSMKFY